MSDTEKLAVFVPAEQLQHEFEAWLEACDPEVQESLAAELAVGAIGPATRTDEQTLLKRDRLASLFDIQQAYVDRLRLCVRAIEERARHEEAKIKRGKWGILTYMLNSCVKSLDGFTRRYVIRSASGMKLRVVNEAMIPREYFEEVLEPKLVLNKEKLTLDLSEGKEVPGAHLEAAQPTLMIK